MKVEALAMFCRARCRVAIETSREAEAASNRGLMGEGSVTDLVIAVGRAELTLQTAVAVRDRVVAAYQEVMRMPI